MEPVASVSESFRTSVRPYILAGGLSSRMGTDKAMLKLAGRSLLGRAVDLLRSVSALTGLDGKVMVTIVGDRTEWEGADRIIPDRRARCGPLGGMEAALEDLDGADGVEWAFFVPVDMPFLPSALIDALVREWREAAKGGARVCWADVDGRVQPLVSMVHRSLLPLIAKALTAGDFKVTQVLESAAGALAVSEVGGIPLRSNVVYRTLVERAGLTSAVEARSATGAQQQLKRLWFSNLNREEDFRNAETFLSSRG